MGERTDAADYAVDDVEEIAVTDEVDEVELTRAQIEQTRAEMSETIDAIKEKLNPQVLVEQAKDTVREATIGRAQEAMSDAVDTAKDAVGSAVDTAKEAVSGAVDTARQAVSRAGDTAREAGSSVVDTIRENPVPYLLIGAGLGWLLLNNRRESSRAHRITDGLDDYTTGSTGQGYSTSRRADEMPTGSGVLTSTEDYSVREERNTVVDAIRANPIPAALTAISVGWLIMSARQESGQSERTYDQTYDQTYTYDYAPENVGYASGYAGYGEQGAVVSSGVQGTGETEGGVGEAVGNAVDTAKDAVGNAVDTARDAASRAGDTARRVAGRVGNTARETGSSLVDTIRANPVPAALTAVGIGWLLMEAQGEGSRPSQMLDQARSRVGDVAGRVQGRAGEIAGQVRDQAGNVTERVRDQAGQVVGQVRDQASNVTERVGYQASLLKLEARQRAEQVQEGLQRTMQNNPLALGAAAMALGAAVGLMLPGTQQEHRVMGEARDRLVEKAQQTAQELGQKVQTVAQETVGGASDAARQAAQEQGLPGVQGGGSSTGSGSPATGSGI